MMRLFEEDTVPYGYGHELSVKFVKYDARAFNPNDNAFQTMPDILLTTAPDQKSPDNIVNILPDDCLRTIFEAFASNIIELVDIANVCYRFNVVAKEIVKSKYTHCDFTNALNMPLWRKINLFRTFGHLIKSLCMGRNDVGCGEVITKYCTSIKELECSFDETRTLDELETVMLRLDVLKMNYLADPENLDDLEDDLDNSYDLYDSDDPIRVMEFDVGERLKCLGISSNCMKIALPNPNLSQLVELYLNSISLRMADRFFHAIPQLQVLKLGKDVSIDMNINAFLDLLPSVAELHIDETNFVQTIDNRYDCKRQHTLLRTIKIWGSEFGSAEILEAIVGHKVPLENLTLNGCTRMAIKFLGLIGKIPTIKCLELDHFVLEDNQIIQLVRETPNLTKLVIKTITVILSDIEKYMKNASQQLTHVHGVATVYDDDESLNGSELERMSRVASDRGINLKLSLEPWRFRDCVDVSMHDFALCKSYYRMISIDKKIHIQLDLVLEEPQVLAENTS